MLHIRVKQTQWTYICENVLEAKALDISYKPWYECDIGDYALSDNGWVVEVLAKAIYEPSGSRKYRMLRLNFYHSKLFSRYINDKPDIKATRFIYNPDDQLKIMSKHAQSVIALMHSGINFTQAMMMIYSRTEWHYIAKRLLSSPVFIRELKKTRYYMNIKQEFENAGITPALLAEKIKESIDSEHFKEKQWAVDLALEYLTKAETSKLNINISSIQVPELQAGIDSYMLHKVPGILPERIEDAVVIDSEPINAETL